MGAPVALSEKTRAEMFRYFAGTPLGEEVTSEMLANFPMLEFDTLVTKDFLRAEIGGLRVELHDEIASVRTDMQAGFTDLAKGLHEDMRTMLVGTVTTMVALFGILAALVAVH